MFFNTQGFFKKAPVILRPHTIAVTKHSASVVNNPRCGNSVCLCSMDFVSGSNIESKKIQCTAGTDSMSTARDKLWGPLAHLLYLSLGIPGCSLAHCATVWWPASCFVVTRTSYMSHSQLFSNKNLWNEKVAKEPQSSQVAK